MSRSAYGKQNGSQAGFTLIEMVVAIAIVTIILGGSAALMYYMTIVTGAQTDQTLANLQVQYVGFWIGEDVIQAKNVSMLNPTVGDLFVLTGEDESEEPYTVTYRVDVNMKDKLGRDLGSLSRIKDGGKGAGNATIAKYLDPSSTMCYYKQPGNGTYVLVLDVTALIDQKVARGTYEINPRAGNITQGGG